MPKWMVTYRTEPPDLHKHKLPLCCTLLTLFQAGSFEASKMTKLVTKLTFAWSDGILPALLELFASRVILSGR